MLQSKFQALEKLRNSCTNLGLKLISNSYDGMRAIYTVQCKEGHLSWIRGFNLKNLSHSCKICRRIERNKSFLNELKKRVASYDISLASNFYENVHTKYTWRCCHGHEWSESYYTLRHRMKCPQCMPRRAHTLSQVQGLCENLNFELLDKT